MYFPKQSALFPGNVLAIRWFHLTARVRMNEILLYITIFSDKVPCTLHKVYPGDAAKKRMGREEEKKSTSYVQK